MGLSPERGEACREEVETQQEKGSNELPPSLPLLFPKHVPIFGGLSPLTKGKPAGGNTAEKYLCKLLSFFLFHAGVCLKC